MAQIEGHLLTYSWNIFFDSGTSTISNANTVNSIVNFDSIETFWGVFDSLGNFADFPKGVDLYFMKDIHKTTELYHKLVFNFSISHSEQCLSFLLNLLLGCLGDSIEHTDMICGVLYSVGGQFKITLLLKKESEYEMYIDIVKFMKRNNTIDEEMKINYTPNEGKGLKELKIN
ncbi:Uncharacterized protein QTN25_005687 [Entamoeba marina]